MATFDDPRYHALAEFPVRFCVPVFFGEFPSEPGARPVSNGCGCILRVDNRLIGITCQHVVQGFRDRVTEVPRTQFTFGPYLINPDEALIDENARLDLATFDLTETTPDPIQLKGMSVIEPNRWPPEAVSTNDVLAFAGLPGVWRESIGSTHLRFYSFSSGATGVDAISEDHFITQVYVEDTLEVLRDGMVVGSLAGMSGGPVFVWRDGSVLHAEFVGVIKEYQESLSLLYIRRVTCVDANGQITDRGV
jgi:hypothetical protein